MSDDGTKAAKAIAHAVALKGALAQAEFFIASLHDYPLHEHGMDALVKLDDEIKVMRATASLLTDSFYKVVGEGG